MIFCSRCFQDQEIKSIIDRLGNNGKCSVCGSTNVPLYDTDINDGLLGIFDNILSVYTPLKDLPETYPPADTAPLVNRLQKDWNIFSEMSCKNIINIIIALSPSVAENVPALFSEPVGIPEKYDIDYLQKHSIIKTEKWANFVNTIKYRNRFHTNQINTNLLKQYCAQIEKIIPAGKQRYYRGRIAYNANGYQISEMGAPPKEKATDGRANSAGISRLYLTYDRETTLHEIRVAEYDYVTIATFKQKYPIKVVDLKMIEAISPFSPDIDCTALAINREHLLKINQEMSRTMRKGDSPLDYLPTQYICDFVMSIVGDDGMPVYDGIEYQSAMRATGANLAIFYPEKFKCTYRQTYEVVKLNYKKELIK